MTIKSEKDEVAENAYKALEEALAIDFQESSPRGSLDPREGKVSDVANQSGKPAGKDTGRSEEIARALAPEPGPKSPSHKPANDQRPAANVKPVRNLDAPKS